MNISKMMLGAATLLMVGGLAAPLAMAQNANPSAAVNTSRLGRMSCSEFTRLHPREQSLAVNRMNQGAPQQSLTSPPMGANRGGMAAAPQSRSGRAAVQGTPLTAGQLVAACQASPNGTVQGAFSRFNSGTGMPAGR